MAKFNKISTIYKQNIIIKMTLDHKNSNIYLQMKICPLTRISSLAQEICPNVTPTGDVFYAERVFLYRNGPMEHTVISVGSIL